jgi:hypothetical protein
MKDVSGVLHKPMQANMHRLYGSDLFFQKREYEEATHQSWRCIANVPNLSRQNDSRQVFAGKVSIRW